jgi:hypothetical protein
VTPYPGLQTLPVAGLGAVGPSIGLSSGSEAPVLAVATLWPGLWEGNG